MCCNRIQFCLKKKTKILGEDWKLIEVSSFTTFRSNINWIKIIFSFKYYTQTRSSISNKINYLTKHNLSYGSTKNYSTFDFALDTFLRKYSNFYIETIIKSLNELQLLRISHFNRIFHYIWYADIFIRFMI